MIWICRRLEAACFVVGLVVEGVVVVGLVDRLVRFESFAAWLCTQLRCRLGIELRSWGQLHRRLHMLADS